VQVAETFKVPARVTRATWAGLREFDISDELGRIGVPTLIVWGDHDRLALSSRQVQDALMQAIPHAYLRVYPGVGHSPHWERPAQFATDVASFVHQVV
jgi:non-heme chloroperoxidase